MLIVTGASDNHYLTLINMINSFVNFSNNKNKLIVYNLGLEQVKWSIIQNLYKNYTNITYKIFDYSKYPEWFNINNEAGQYAWKPTIIYNTWLENENEIIVWMDSGNLIFDNLDNLETFILTNNIYSCESSGDIKLWTHPDTIKYMNCTWTDKQNRNAACVGFNTKVNYVKDFLLEFYNCAQIKECIAPNGSSRKNHRQDQAVFSILFYKYNIIYEFNSYISNDWKVHLGYTIHNDVEPHWDS
jgi:hypothetical protein